MGKERERKRKSDRIRDDALHNEKQRLKNRETNKQKSTSIEDIANDDVIRVLGHNVDDMNVQNKIQEKLNQVCTNIVNLFKMQ